jgi:predicted DNA-binding transcriptional regulator YafY
MNFHGEIAIRIFEVWKVFQDGKVHKSKDLAAMFAVCPKTIDRDIETLRDLGCDFISNRNSITEAPGRRLVKVVCPCCQKEIR